MEARQHPRLMHVMTHSVKKGHFPSGFCLFSWCLHTSRPRPGTKGTYYKHGVSPASLVRELLFEVKGLATQTLFSFAREAQNSTEHEGTDAGPIQPFVFWSLSNRQGKGWAGLFLRTMKTRREGTTLAETGALAFETLFGNLRLPTLFRRSLSVT